MTPNPLQPGAELDAEVAMAMGAEPMVYHFHKYREPLPSDMWCTAVVDMGERRESYPSYSTDMGCAWLVVEHMRKGGWVFRVAVYISHVDCDFCMGDLCFQWTSKSAPEAICLAFLAAVASGRKERR